MDEQSVMPSPPPAPQPPLTPAPAGSTTGMIKKIVIGLLALGVVGVGLALWWMVVNNGRNLAVEIIAPERIQTGVPVEVAVTLNNESSDELRDAQVSLSLPDNLMFVGTPGRRSVELHQVGAVAANTLAKELFTVMAVGNENSIAQIRASVSYVPGALSSRFEQTIEKEIIVGEAGIELNIAAPTKAFGGEEFVTEITYRNLSATSIGPARLKLVYPTGFSFISASQPATDATNTTWDLSVLRPGIEGQLSIKGRILGQDNENFELRGAITAMIGEGEYDVALQSAIVTMQPSPLSIQISAAPSNEAFFAPGDTLQYRLNYVNNTNLGLRDVIIQAKLVGEMFDLKSLKTTGVLRSSDATVSWNASRLPTLANVPPGATGYVEFSINTKKDYPITRLSSKNYTLTVQASIESPTVPNNVAADKTIGVASLTNKMRGALNLSVLGYYRDAASGIANAGVFPPKVGQPTQFTIHWVLRNTSTDVDQARLRAFLGPNVRYTGVQKSNVASANVSYNDRTQELVWDVGRVQATRGVISDPLELIFQVELTPAANQVQTTPILIQETQLSYVDAFTGETLSGIGRELTTRLPDDATITGGDRSVKE